ncbi:MAG: type II toxin-antitoxin system VapC family toxin [Terracidiphilus sp.]
MILLDTHIVVWLMVSPEQLSDRARVAILQASIAGEKIAYSPVSLYEIANAARRNRLHLYTTIEEFIAAIGAKLELIPLTAAIAVCAAKIPVPFHGDPMDRIIAATAIVGDLTLITRDDRIRAANVCKVLW